MTRTCQEGLWWWGSLAWAEVPRASCFCITSLSLLLLRLLRCVLLQPLPLLALPPPHSLASVQVCLFLNCQVFFL